MRESKGEGKGVLIARVLDFVFVELVAQRTDRDAEDLRRMGAVAVAALEHHRADGLGQVVGSHEIGSQAPLRLCDQGPKTELESRSSGEGVDLALELVDAGCLLGPHRQADEDGSLRDDGQDVGQQLRARRIDPVDIPFYR